MGFSSPLIPFQENENISEKETKKDYIFSIILCDPGKTAHHSPPQLDRKEKKPTKGS